MNTTLILNKNKLKKIREIHNTFQNCLENNYSLIFFSNQQNKIINYSMHQCNEQVFEVPMNHNLLHVQGCLTKKYLISISQNSKTGFYSVIFWSLYNSKVIFILNEDSQPEGIQMLDSSRLLLYSKNRLKVFDTSTFQCLKNIKVEGRIKEVQLIRKYLLLLILQDEKHFTINLDTKETVYLSDSDSIRMLIYLISLKKKSLHYRRLTYQEIIR